MNLRMWLKYKSENEQKHFKEINAINLSKVNAFQLFMMENGVKISTFLQKMSIKNGCRC